MSIEQTGATSETVAECDFYWYEDEAQLKHDLETWGKAEKRGFRPISPLYSFAEGDGNAVTAVSGTCDLEDRLAEMLPYGDPEYSLGKLIGRRLERLAEAIDALVARKALAGDYEAAVKLTEMLRDSVVGLLIDNTCPTQDDMKEVADSTREFAEQTKDRW